MSGERRNPLLSAARAVSDGKSIDWASLTVDHPALARRLRGLRLIQSVAQACEAPIELPEESGEGASAPSSWGPLQILEKVGAGGFGEVFRAFDSVLHREVALKLRRLDGEADEAAFEVHLQEARRLARVRHPHVLTVHGVEIHDGRAGMWTDFIHGATLEERLTREGPPTSEEISRIGLDLCSALAAVHDAGLIHGDIKTANAMLDPSGRVILMDFGAGATLAPDGAPFAGSPLGASPQGTPAAMAYELFLGALPSSASDIYALGVLLYRLASGRSPIQASSWDELIEKHRSGDWLSIGELRPDLSPHLVRIIDRCLARDPEDRPVDAREVLSFLRASATRSEGDQAADEARIASGNLPSFPSRFVGRRAELRQLRALLLEPGITTLTGSGGCGKTRLAHRAAEEAGGLLRDGAWWVDLGELADGAFLEQSVLRSLGLTESRRQAPVDQLTEHLRGRSLLLVLDNCEHMIRRCAEFVASFLTSAPRLRILATSREPLGLPGERTLRIPSLSLPSGDGLEILDSEAVRLFVDRASRQSPGFVITPQITGAVARIARCLDGIPLAIELAASRVGALSPDQIADRLEAGSQLLTSRATNISPRQRTLLASIDWSYQLLTPEEKRCLSRCSIFAGGWTLEAAEDVCADRKTREDGACADAEDPEDLTADDLPREGGGGIGPAPGSAGDAVPVSVPVLDLLEGLVHRSMVQFDPAAQPPRYRLLEMVRVFALDRMREESAGEEPALRDRHLRHFLGLARAHEKALTGIDGMRALPRLEAEIHNLRAALEWSRRRPEGPGRDPGTGLRLCLALGRFWFLRESYREGSEHFAVQLARATSHDVTRGRALVMAANLAWPIGDVDRAWQLAEAGLEVLRAAGDGWWIAVALNSLGFLADLRGDIDASLAIFEECLTLHQAQGRANGVATVSTNMGVLESRRGNHPRAVTHYERALVLLREQGDETNCATTLRNMSYSVLQLGDTARARRLAEEGVLMLRRGGQRRLLANSLAALALIALQDRNPEEARRHSLEAMHLAREAGEQVTLLKVLTTLSVVAYSLEENRQAVRLMGAAEALHETLQASIMGEERADWDSRIEVLRGRLGAARFEALRAEGRALSLESALRMAEGVEADEADPPRVRLD